MNEWVFLEKMLDVSFWNTTFHFTIMSTTKLISTTLKTPDVVFDCLQRFFNYDTKELEVSQCNKLLKSRNNYTYEKWASEVCKMSTFLSHCD